MRRFFVSHKIPKYVFSTFAQILKKMENISFKIEKTTSDTIIKFTANSLLISGSHQFNNIDEAKNAPLAQQLFHLPFVKRVLFSANFIALERFSIVEWSDVQEEVKQQIEDLCVFNNEINFEQTVFKMKQIVPEYISNNSTYEVLDK